jgi:outer membrane protein assembly factor BamD
MSTYARRFPVLAALAAASLVGCATPHPYRGMTAEQVYEMARGKYEAGKYDDAIKALDHLLSTFAAADVIPEARMLQADASYAKGDYIPAQADYQRYLDRYPGTPKAPMASLGVCKCLVALSPIAQRDQSYTQDAYSQCRGVSVDYPGTPQAASADTLATKMRNKLAQSEYDHAEYYFRRKIWDSAIVYYQYVDSVYPETPAAPKALLGLYKANKKIGYDDVAAQVKKKLLADFPDSPEAKSLASDGGA